MVVHLRMTGKLLYLPASEPWGKHTHIVFALSDGHTLRYDDVRQFGTLQLTETAGCMGLSCLAALGPEPLDDDFTPQWLQQHFDRKKKKRPKPFLLDQHNIAGIGNIYADEILFQAGIHPEEPVCKLADIATAERLWFAIRDRLSRGIAYGGSSIKDYVDSFGQSGSFQKLHKSLWTQRAALCRMRLSAGKNGFRRPKLCLLSQLSGKTTIRKGAILKRYGFIVSCVGAAILIFVCQSVIFFGVWTVFLLSALCLTAGVSITI